MRKREVVCAFYIPDSKKFDKYNKFMKVIVENKKKIKPIYYEEEESQILIVFYKDRLSKIGKELSGDALDMYKEIGGKYRHCAVCRCGYLSYIPYTYRDNCGLVGRSYECEVCKSLSDREVSYVTEYMKKHGSKKTLIRILNGKIFKHYIIPDDPIDDELPF